MDSKNETAPDETPTRPTPKSGAERVRKHRKRKQQLELQIAFGIAKAVIGRGVGEQRKALLALLEKAARSGSVPDDVLSAIDEAIDKLKSRQMY
jgi:hypothetical protein